MYSVYLSSSAEIFYDGHNFTSKSHLFLSYQSSLYSLISIAFSATYDILCILLFKPSTRKVEFSYIYKNIKPAFFKSKQTLFNGSGIKRFFYWLSFISKANFILPNTKEKLLLIFKKVDSRTKQFLKLSVNK